MLAKLHLANFRCFNDHTVELRPTTIIVGRNNAGKSTIVDALRLVSTVVSRYHSISFSSPPPDLTEVPRYSRGVRPDFRGISLELGKSVFYHYGDPPAIVSATFSSGEEVRIYINSDEIVYAEIRNAQGKLITNKSEAQKVSLSSVSILPQVAPVSKSENALVPQYVRSNLSSGLAPVHFRNQLKVLHERFDEFRTLSEESWPGLQIKELHGMDYQPGTDDTLSLQVRDGDFTAEIGNMGHGLQMWLQTMWFLTRTKDAQTIILDEPDVYMHPDLQRRLVRMLHHQPRQVIIATHSIEIMAEVEPDEVLVIDRTKDRSSFATSLPAVQSVVEHIGGVHNLQLARLWSSHRFLLVEGDDIPFLQKLQDTLCPNTKMPFSSIPNAPIGGWGGWPYAVAAPLVLKNSGGESIIPYCILDSDYHTKEVIDKRYKEAKKSGINLHIWKRKELENYLLVPSAICRVIADRMCMSRSIPAENDIQVQMHKIAQSMYDDVLQNTAGAIQDQKRGMALKTAMAEAKEQLKTARNNPKKLLSRVSGKELLSKLSDWSKQTFNVSFSSASVAKALTRDEIPAEVINVITAIEHGLPLPEKYERNNDAPLPRVSLL